MDIDTEIEKTKARLEELEYRKLLQELQTDIYEENKKILNDAKRLVSCEHIAEDDPLVLDEDITCGVKTILSRNPEKDLNFANIYVEFITPVYFCEKRWYIVQYR